MWPVGVWREARERGRESLIRLMRGRESLMSLMPARGIWQARLKESESGLVSCNKELSEVKSQLKMAQQEAKDTRHLLQQSQLALERDRRRCG
jgi:hypothetical protein